MGYKVETVKRLYDDMEAVFIEVGPHPDGIGLELRTVGEESIKWYGPINLCLSDDHCMKLGKMLIDAVNVNSD